MIARIALAAIVSAAAPAHAAPYIDNIPTDDWEYWSNGRNTSGNGAGPNFLGQVFTTTSAVEVETLSLMLTLRAEAAVIFAEWDGDRIGERITIQPFQSSDALVSGGEPGTGGFSRYDFQVSGLTLDADSEYIFLISSSRTISSGFTGTDAGLDEYLDGFALRAFGDPDNLLLPLSEYDLTFLAETRDLAFEINGSIVPAPGTLAVMLGLACPLRRRRR